MLHQRRTLRLSMVRGDAGTSKGVAVCACAEERKPVSYKLKQGELDAPDPTPQRSNGQSDGGAEGGEEQNDGKEAASEDYSAADLGEDETDGKAGREKDAEVHDPTHVQLLGNLSADWNSTFLWPTESVCMRPCVH